MSFKTELSALIQSIPGALGAILADWEGEAVDHVSRMDDYELKVIGAHQGVILSNLREVVGRLQGDSLQEVVITTEKNRTLILPVTEDYFLVLLLEKKGLLGRALFEARRCQVVLRKEIA